LRNRRSRREPLHPCLPRSRMNRSRRRCASQPSGAATSAATVASPSPRHFCWRSSAVAEREVER
jgi:hypothetical protein